MLEQMLMDAVAAQEAEVGTGAPETTEGSQVETEATPEAETAADEPEVEAETEEQPEAEAAAAPAAPELVKTPSEARAEEEALFDEKALSTPDGLKAARKWAHAKRAEIISRSAKIERKQATLTEKVKTFAAERDATRAERERVIAYEGQIKQALHQLTTGSAKDVLDMLGRLTGKDPSEFYREMSHTIASNGKTNGKTSPEAEQMKAELAELKRQLQEREEREAEYALEQAKDRIYSAAIAVKADATATYPHIARLAAESPEQATEIREHLAELKIKRHNAGTPISDQEAAQDLENRLARALGSSSPPQSGKTGQAPASGQAPPNPKPPKSLNSKDRSAPAQRRERGQETVEELAQDQSLMGAIFG
jgi:hypothetical protein